LEPEVRYGMPLEMAREALINHPVAPHSDGFEHGEVMAWPPQRLVQQVERINLEHRGGVEHPAA
jgi:hypothetical protein